jgi:integrase
MAKRIKTAYPGVYFREARRIGGKGMERVYYIVFKKNGKVHEEKVGRQFVDDLTPARAAGIRSQRIEGKRPSRKEKREKALKKTQEKKWTINRLWESYEATRTPGKSLAIDEGRYNKYLMPVFGDKEPKDLIRLDVDRLRIRLLKKKTPQTVKHVLNLLTWIVNYAVKNGLCQGLSFHVQKPTVNNIKTEDLTQEQLAKLLDAIDKDSNRQVADLMKLALFTGMRRGELFGLEWKDIDVDRGFINIRDPKSGVDQVIPMNEPARSLLALHEKTESPYVFPGQRGEKRVTAQIAVNRIKKHAGLPKDFRPLHGLRHTYASMLASSGQVDMYVLQRLLTHKSPLMTQRYAHLRDEALKKASDLAGDIIGDALNGKTSGKVINLKEQNK